ncbi:hypothetical protein [Cupriavidus sp. AcVe19-6a]|uniref:hypothetical protein n=1 Tax=Cupriavidus sp. AcVe19-6a TaxID=2821358 RepID=UPI001AE76150|nr:hypothetical protein [Cupriavidus sp. AcVe19-6a]MBP0640020.1 hypothetical protein [Cupriavidus sp. AcVe19-6a]
MNIYQEIWDADQSGNGVRSILATDDGDRNKGYVKVANSKTLSETGSQSPAGSGHPAF